MFKMQPDKLGGRFLSCGTILALVLALSKTGELTQVGEQATFKAGFSNANIKLQYSIASSPMNTTHRLKLAKCLYNIRRGAIRFLAEVTGPEFSRMDYDWARETQALFDVVIAEARDLGNAFAENEERFSQIESVRQFLSEAAISLTTGIGSAPTVAANEEDKTFSMEEMEDYLEEIEETFVRLTALDWKIYIPTISINGVNLNEIIMEQVALLNKLGLRKAVEGLSSGFEEFWKVINEAHSKHLQTTP